MELSIEKREHLLGLLGVEYVVPDEMIDCVKEAVKLYSTKNYSDDAIDKMVRTPQSLSKGLALLRERNVKNDLSLFRGILTKWLVCAEYNARKNKGAVDIYADEGISATNTKKRDAFNRLIQDCRDGRVDRF